jgi:Pyocin activator protein PrtN
VQTIFLLMARYQAVPIIPLPAVCRDFFPHLSPEKFLRKVMAGEINLPIVRMESSQKTAKGVHVTDMAEYLDKQTEAARKECRALSVGSAAA